MKRRTFLGALAAIGAGLALPRWTTTLPTRRVEIAPRLWGDGVHDDTAALQWYIARAKPIPRGDYFITRTLRVPRTGSVIMEWSRLEGKRGVDPLILFEPKASGSLLYGNVFKSVKADV